MKQKKENRMSAKTVQKKPVTPVARAKRIHHPKRRSLIAYKDFSLLVRRKKIKDLREAQAFGKRLWLKWLGKVWSKKDPTVQLMFATFRVTPENVRKERFFKLCYDLMKTGKAI